jgi:hypothetical protein
MKNAVKRFFLWLYGVLDFFHENSVSSARQMLSNGAGDRKGHENELARGASDDISRVVTLPLLPGSATTECGPSEAPIFFCARINNP